MYEILLLSSSLRVREIPVHSCACHGCDCLCLKLMACYHPELFGKYHETFNHQGFRMTAQLDDAFELLFNEIAFENLMNLPLL